MRRSPPLLTPPRTLQTGRASILTFVRVEPLYLDLVLSPEEELALDDALEERGIGLSESIRWRHPRTGLFDLASGAGALVPIARTILGREAETILRVEGLVPFDFSSFDALPAMEEVLSRLPSFLAGQGPFRFFGSDESRPPFLWASHEAPGLHIAGVLHEKRWSAWAAAFEQATATWPRRL